MAPLIFDILKVGKGHKMGYILYTEVIFIKYMTLSLFLSLIVVVGKMEEEGVLSAFVT